MNALRRSAFLLLLVCAVWVDHSAIVLAQEDIVTPVAAAAPAAADAHDASVTGLASGGETPAPTISATEPTANTAPEVTTTTSTEAPTTMAPTTTTTTTTTAAPTTMPSSTASPSTPSTTEATTARTPVPGAHNQVAENTTTAAPTTTTAKPSGASMGAALSVATLVFGLCLVHL